jgi:hypothetical protein
LRPAEESARRDEVARQAVMDRRDPVERRQGLALGVRDRDQRHLGEGAIERRQVGQVLPTVQRGERRGRDLAEQREVQDVDVEMQDVELGAAPPHLVQHDREMGRGSRTRGSRRSAVGTVATSSALVIESPLANSVTSWPRRTSSSVR